MANNDSGGGSATEITCVWQRVLDLDELPDGRVKPVSCGHTTVCMTHHGGEYAALYNKCRVSHLVFPDEVQTLPADRSAKAGSPDGRLTPREIAPPTCCGRRSGPSSSSATAPDSTCRRSSN